MKTITLTNRIFTGIKDWKINDILEDKNGKRYLIGWRNEKFVAVHSPTCGSEREEHRQREFWFGHRHRSRVRR